MHPGGVGKMISPQSIAVATGAGDLVGKESALCRFTVNHSFILLTTRKQERTPDLVN